MHLGLVLDMVHSGYGDRTAVTVDGADPRLRRAGRPVVGGSARFAELGVPSVIYVGPTTWPTRWRSSGRPGPGFRSSRSTTAWAGPAGGPDRRPSRGARRRTGTDVPEAADPAPGRRGRATSSRRWPVGRRAPPAQDPDLPAVLLYTSGTTAAPKAAVLRHRHLHGLPARHGRVRRRRGGRALAGVASRRTTSPGWSTCSCNVYAGRRIVYLDRLRPRGLARDGARPGRSPRPWSSRPCWPGSSSHLGEADDAADADAPRSSPTAGPGCRRRSSTGPCELFSTPASSTPTG